MKDELERYLFKHQLLSRETVAKVRQRKVANHWILSDLLNDRPSLQDQLNRLYKTANDRVGDNCVALLNLMIKEQDYLEAHGAKGLSNSVWVEMTNQKKFVHDIGDEMDKAHIAYEAKNYYYAYVHAYRLRHLLNLAKPK